MYVKYAKCARSRVLVIVFRGETNFYYSFSCVQENVKSREDLQFSDNKDRCKTQFYLAERFR